MKIACLLLMALVGLGCGRSATDELALGREALAKADYGDALAAADSGLAEEPDEVTAWGL